MIVCHITSTLGTGVGNTVTRLINGIKKLGHKIYLIYLPIRQDMKCDRYNLTAKRLSDHEVYVESKEIFDKTYSLKIMPLILSLRNKVDLFHCHITTFGMSNLLRAFIMGTLSKIIRKPFFLSFYIFPDRSLSRCKQPVIRTLLKLLTSPVSRITTPSYFSKRILLKIGIDARKIIALHPAINTEVYKPIADTDFRSKLGVGYKDFLILYLGALRPDKGVEYLIKAFHKLTSRLGKNGKHVFLAIVLCNWTHNNLKFGVRPYDIDYYQPIEVLRSGYATCGGFSVVLASLCISIGMEARVVGIVNSTQEGHMITEVLVDDHWAVFDPTYNAYYEVNGTLLSAWELHNNPQISLDPPFLRSFYEGRIYVKYSDRYDNMNYILFMHDYPCVWMNNHNIGILYGNATLPLHTEYGGSGLLITLMVWLFNCRVRLAFPIVPNVVLIIFAYCIFYLLSSKGVDRSRNKK